MDIPKKIIDEVAAKMLDHRIVMEDVAIVPNIFLIYLHKDDHVKIKFLLNTLRQQIIVRLNKEIAKRKKKSATGVGRLGKLLELLGGFSISGSDPQMLVPDDWDISFETTDRDVLVGDEIFPIKKGEICVVAAYSDSKSKPNSLLSNLNTFVTIYKADNSRVENVVAATANPNINKSSGVDADPENSSPADTKVLAILVCKYNGQETTETFEMVKDKITVGRDINADFVLLKASDRISRRHLEINHKDDKFYLKSFGIYGTAVQGKAVPISEKILDNTIRDLNNEVELPGKARIALAGGEVLIDFSRTVKK